MVKINPITLNIEEELWKEFCSLIPDTRTKNGTMVELIEQFIKKEGEKNEEPIQKRTGQVAPSRPQ